MKYIPCQWCGAHLPPHEHGVHVRDSGDAVTCPPTACPVLFERRNKSLIESGRQLVAT